LRRRNRAPPRARRGSQAGRPLSTGASAVHRPRVVRSPGEQQMTTLLGLKCHLCGAKYPAEALWVCRECLGPLEVVYDYALVRQRLTRETVEARPRNLWRYRELLPIT